MPTSSLNSTWNVNSLLPSWVAGRFLKLAVRPFAGASFADMVTVAVPICVPAWLAATAIVSALSSPLSSTAVTVAVTVPCPATRVSVSGETTKSAPFAAVLPVNSRAIAWSAAKVTPLVIATVTVDASPSAISAGLTVTSNVAASSSSTSTSAEAAPGATR